MDFMRRSFLDVIAQIFLNDCYFLLFYRLH